MRLVCADGLSHVLVIRIDVRRSIVQGRLIDAQKARNRVVEILWRFVVIIALDNYLARFAAKNAHSDRLAPIPIEL